jgi:nucleoside transporter
MSSRLMLRLKLGAMMFFQYAVWGAWTPILGATIASRLNASGAEIGAVYGVLWLACIIAPFIGGQIVDRIMPSQVYLGIAGVVCTFAAYMMSTQHSIGTMFSGGLITWMWVWSLAFAPTIGIANSIAMYHLGKEGTSPEVQERDFSLIRTAGTVGWIAASLVLTYILFHKPPVAKGTWAPYEEMQLAAAFGVILTIVAFLLPNTPPSKEVKDPWAFTKAFSMFATVPGFLVFMAISFLISTEFQFYYVFSGPFMEDGMKIPHELISLYKSIAQYAEIICLGVFTPLSLKYLGMRKTLVIGALAWPLRYFIFAFYKVLPVPIVLASMSFHGIGFAFVFVTSYIYIDRIAPRDIRASAQSLFTLVTLGVGNWLGTLFSGWLKDHYTTFVPDPAQAGHMIPGDVNWQSIFVIPAITTTVCGIAYLITFREPRADSYVEETVPAKI